jgi:hypothetical protein
MGQKRNPIHVGVFVAVYWCEFSSRPNAIPSAAVGASSGWRHRTARTVPLTRQNIAARLFPIVLGKQPHGPTLLLKRQPE